ncbi:MAG: Disulfide bond formation protein D precursor [bacterium ADurb.Bin270]|nr:thioredoxin domain-containing protein [Myxococcales bacterium]OQA61151.1 MAG: Disulfide bond formation protein D precursor [bacterium ADurb.Bin270]
MRKILLCLALFLALAAVFLSAVSMKQHYRVQREGFEKPAFCAISERINCDIVSASQSSQLFGIPNGGWGIIFYSSIAMLLIFILASVRKRDNTLAFTWILSVVGFLYGAWMIYVTAFALRVFCFINTPLYLTAVILFVILSLLLPCRIGGIPHFVFNYFLSVVGRKSDISFKPKFFSHLFFMALAVIIGLIAIRVWGSVSHGKSADSDVDQQAKYFSMQGKSSIDIDPNWPVWGNPDADVTIVEFSEYQCPFCKIAAFGVKPYLYDFKDKVRYYFVNFPLDNACNEEMTRPMHPVACYAAKAAICSQTRGDFWKFHDELFRAQKGMTRKTVDSIAESFGYDMQDFASCIASPETESRVKDDLAAARKLGITGTPTIYINGKKARYWRNPEFLRMIIKSEIRRGHR